jgi:hypothetical protein
MGLDHTWVKCQNEQKKARLVNEMTTKPEAIMGIWGMSVCEPGVRQHPFPRVGFARGPSDQLLLSEGAFLIGREGIALLCRYISGIPMGLEKQRALHCCVYIYRGSHGIGETFLQTLASQICSEHRRISFGKKGKMFSRIL